MPAGIMIDRAMNQSVALSQKRSKNIFNWRQSNQTYAEILNTSNSHLIRMCGLWIDSFEVDKVIIICVELIVLRLIKVFFICVELIVLRLTKVVLFVFFLFVFISLFGVS